MRHENPKHKQGDGAGFGRLRAAQHMREEFASICGRSHPSCAVFIDKVHEYAGNQVVFYRAKSDRFEHARCAVFERQGNGAWRKLNDVIVAQE